MFDKINIMDSNNKIVLFQEKQIRREWHENEWWFSITDIMRVLTDSNNPSVYWRVLKKRLIAEGSEVVTKCNALRNRAIFAETCRIYYGLP